MSAQVTAGPWSDLEGARLVACDASAHVASLVCDEYGCGSFVPIFVATNSCAVPDEVEELPRPSGAIADTWGRRKLMELAMEAPPDELIEFHIRLPETAFDFSQFRIPGLDRAQFVESRKASLREAQELAEGIVWGHGGTVLSTTWLVNGIVVSVPARSIPDLVDEPHFVDVSPALAVSPLAKYSGLEITEGTLSQQLYLGGYDGESGGRTWVPDDNTKIGISEPGSSNLLNCGHIGWQDWPGGPSRIAKTASCTGSGCGGHACSTASSHGTVVTSIAAGSIEQGQDSNFPGTQTAAQRARSGVSQEVSAYYYAFDTTCGALKSIETAVADGVDVLNMSWGIGGDCDLSANSCNVNQAIDNATNAGLLFVAGAGNDPPTAEDGFCSVDWPAVRSRVLSVGALDTDDNSIAYEDVVRSIFYAYGSKDVTVVGGATRELNLVDLVAPAHVRLYFASGVNGYDGEGTFGTSYAAPIVAAIGGLTREWMFDLNWNSFANNASCVFTNLLLMGDFYSGSRTNPREDYRNTVSNSVGMGRVRAHWPSGASLGTGSWSWATGWHTLTTGNTHYYSLGGGNPMPTSVQGVKAVLAWFGDYNTVSDMRLHIVDLCPAGGGEQVLRSAASNQTMRQHVQLTASSHIHGRCLYIKVQAVNAKSGGQQYHCAGYHYSNNGVYH